MGLISQIQQHRSSAWRERMGQIGTSSALDGCVAPVPGVDVLGHRIVEIV